jgi:cell fate regulator YaaT (PSP1 superfamily)
VGDYVIVETENGPGFATVVCAPVPIEKKKTTQPLKKIFRPANEKDFLQVEQNRQTEAKAYRFCCQCIKELSLEMNLFFTESNFDGSKLTFFFTADGRVDFRKLVKMLVKEFRTKIEMRQVGIRNKAKMCGGIGRCGRELCCSAFITKFDPVSIKMAKKQGLSLNPTKISGVCGRLMCCLTFENNIYEGADDLADVEEEVEQDL